MLRRINNKNWVQRPHLASADAMSEARIAISVRPVRVHQEPLEGSGGEVPLHTARAATYALSPHPPPPLPPSSSAPRTAWDAGLAWYRLLALVPCLLVAGLPFIFAQGQQIHRLVPPAEIMQTLTRDAVHSANTIERRTDPFDLVAIGVWYAVGALGVANFALQFAVVPFWVAHRVRHDRATAFPAPRAGLAWGLAFFRMMAVGGRWFWLRFAALETLGAALQVARLCLYGGVTLVPYAQVCRSHNVLHLSHVFHKRKKKASAMSVMLACTRK